MNELVIDGKTYVSSKRAAEITGYAKDYVGQLCREGRVEARLVGRAWYVLETSLREHRFGAEEAVSEPEKPEKPSITDTWDTLRYEPEPVLEPVVPLPEKPTVNVLAPSYAEDSVAAEPEAAPQRLAESLSDLQSAWKDWFSRKESPEDPAEVPVEPREELADEEAVDTLDLTERPSERELEAFEEEVAIEESEEVTVPIERIRVRSYQEPEPVVLELREEEAVIIEERRVAPRKRRAHGAVYALLLLVSAVSITLAVLGSGIADQYVSLLPLSAVNALSGVRSFVR